MLLVTDQLLVYLVAVVLVAITPRTKETQVAAVL
jgi:hypothetical protein